MSNHLKARPATATPNPETHQKLRQSPTSLGGVAIAPGRRATVDLPLADLSTHAPVNMSVRVIHGRYAGPRLFICAALHGDEINGVEIIRRVLRLSSLGKLRGTLVAVPIVNVLGFLAQSRYLPDRRDLNRSFPGSPHGSLTARLARLFMDEIVAPSSYGIDLHTGAIHRDNFPHVRGNLDDPDAELLARSFGVPLVINTGYPAGSLRDAAAKVSVPVIVYEAGEALRFNEPYVRAGVSGVVRVMRTIGMLPPSRRQLRRRPDPVIIRSTRWIRAERSGLLRSTAELGRNVADGDLLGTITDPLGDTELEVRAATGGVVIGKTRLPLVHEGDALFHIARHEGTQVVARSLDAFEPQTDYESGLTAELAGDLPIV
ncbi:MAG: succinylglutamate desuccinylase/aspartoacylase family protein [Proteobacteria bacterium]|nr:succinylglutamate desuccinylase/aspartoacylase family protein [Pseudomonadota bacterium]